MEASGPEQTRAADLPEGENVGEAGTHQTDRSEAGITPDAPAPDLELGERPEDPETAQSEAERHPAEDQAPIATAADEAIVGDSGMYEQQPINSPGSADTPVRTSAPPASLQSGVPLPEDRAAGVEPGPAGPR